LNHMKEVLLASALRFRYIPIRLLWRRFLADRALSIANIESTASIPDITDKFLSKRKRTKSSIATRWEAETVDELANELKYRRFKFATNMNEKSAQSQLIRYAVNEDFASLVAFVMQFVDAVARNSTQYRGDDEFFAVSLLLSARGMRTHNSIDIQHADSAEALSLFYTLSALLEKMPVLGGDTRAAWIILLDSMEKWIEMRSIDERSSDIDRILISLQRKIARNVRGWLPKENRLLFSDDNWNIVTRRLMEMRGKSNETDQVMREDYGYNKNLRLVDALRFEASEREYLGSPFSSLRITKDEYMKNLMEQLLLESTHCLRVRNFCRISEKVTAEKLIEEWGWKEAMQRTLAKHLQQLRQFPLKGYMSVLDVSEVSSLMLTSILAICGLGQQMVAYSYFEYALAVPILEVLHRKFIEKITHNRQQLCEELFSEYIRYFLEPSLSRRFTLREWWMRCCRTVRIDPTLQLPFHDFHAEIRRQLGSFLLNVLMESCTFPLPSKDHSSNMKDRRAQAFRIRNVVIEEENVMVEEEKMSLCKMVAINARMLDLFDEHQFEWLLFPSDNLPMKIPPRPWIDCGDGGPLYTKPSDVFRNLPDYPRMIISDEVRRRIHSRSQARPVFDALNDLGATPWRINSAMLDILIEVFKMTSDLTKGDMLHRLAIPLRSDTIKIPDFVATFGEKVRVDEIPSDKWREYSKNKYEAIKKRNELNSLWYWLMYRLVMAEHFRNDVLFFAHNMDFRGRVYPISPYLSHMGDDISRSLLRFAEGKQLGDDGFRWLKLHCINLTGHLKRESIENRLAFFEKILPKILDSANNPLNGDRWWMRSDEPWQTLAACIEIRDALRSGNPSTFVSHLPIHQDGSCNGLQHYAALGRDRQGGSEVNLLPSKLPADVYSSVAKRVEEKRLEDEKSDDPDVKELAVALRAALPYPVPRKVIKQTVMTTVYGVTMYGATQQIKRQLKALEIESDELGKFASYLAQKTFASLHDAFTSSMQLKVWFRQCAKAIVHLMYPVEWETPLGLPVMQPYLKLKKKHNKLCLHPVMIKQVNAFPPNFVHSLDSTHMMLTTLHCRRLGITFAAVHDCYWTHACHVDRMNELCRDQFILLHKQPIVQQCGKFFIEKYLPPRRRKAMEATELAHFESVFKPSMKTGLLDIEDVRKSVYFFS
uniref:DNA-directed RNA polymerase n=1 Tax=Parascaris univalens TaxID=6257 RepID=A0A915BIX9_PARUN